MTIPLPADVSAQLGLGPHFEITTLKYTWAKVQLQTTEGPKTLHVLIMEDGSGRHGYAFTPDDASTFGKACIRATTGLALASQVPTNERLRNDY